MLRTRSKENTFYENPFYSRTERVLCKIYKCASGQTSTSRAAQQIISAVERCAKRLSAMAAKKRRGAAVGGRDPGAAATSRTGKAGLPDASLLVHVASLLNFFRSFSGNI
jgi:hypothetical protein